MTRDDQLYGAHRPAHGRHRRACTNPLFPRHVTRAGLRARRAERRRRALRDLPLCFVATERTWVLLLARPSYGRADPPIRVVHHQIANRHGEWHAHRVHGLVLAAALLRSISDEL